MTNQVINQKSTIFITGASSGIGHSIAKVYARTRANLIICARRQERLESLKQELEDAGSQVLVCVCDVSDEASVEKAINDSVERFGKIDSVYANAGFGLTEYFENLSNKDYHRQFATNIFGVLNTARHSLPHLVRSQGKLAIMGSVSSYVCTPADSPYSMSKAAVRALADTLFLENKSKGVSVTFVAPGFVTSEIRHKDNAENLKADSPDKAPAWTVMPTMTAAEKIVRGVEARKREIVITGFGKFIVTLRRLLPNFTLNMVGSSANKIDRRRKSV